jgi:hypothetical protein
MDMADAFSEPPGFYFDLFAAPCTPCCYDVQTAFVASHFFFRLGVLVRARLVDGDSSAVVLGIMKICR